MKSIYNSLKTPVSEVIKEGIKTTNVLEQAVKHLKIEDKVNINSNKFETNKQPVSFYNPSLMQKMVNSDFEQYNSLKLTNLNQSGVKKYGLTNISRMQFSTNVEKMERFADPTNDVAFKKIFSEDNIDGIKDFVEAIIINAKDFPFSSKFQSIEFLNKDQMPDLYKGKRSLCDLKVEDNEGNIYIIEMQKRNEQDYLERIQYYSAHAITDQLERGESHAKINPVITISIMGRKCFDDGVPCISYHPYRETVTNKQLLLAQSHVFIELPKLESSNFLDNTLEWLEMFKNAPSLNKIPNVHNGYVKNAYQKLEKHNWSKEERDAYVDAKVYDDMEKSNIEHAIEKGETMGIEKGKIEGENKAKIEMARKMLAKNKDLEEIIELTGLTKEDVFSLRNEN